MRLWERRQSPSNNKKSRLWSKEKAWCVPGLVQVSVKVQCSSSWVILNASSQNRSFQPRQCHGLIKYDKTPCKMIWNDWKQFKMTQTDQFVLSHNVSSHLSSDLCAKLQISLSPKHHRKDLLPAATHPPVCWLIGQPKVGKRPTWRHQRPRDPPRPRPPPRHPHSPSKAVGTSRSCGCPLTTTKPWEKRPSSGGKNGKNTKKRLELQVVTWKTSFFVHVVNVLSSGRGTKPVFFLKTMWLWFSAGFAACLGGAVQQEQCRSPGLKGKTNMQHGMWRNGELLGRVLVKNHTTTSKSYW